MQNNPRTGRPYALGDLVDAGEIIIVFRDDEYTNQVKIESKELDLEISKMEFDKQQSLYEKGGVTLRELKNAEIKYVNTKIDLENAKINLAKMKVEAPFRAMLTEIPYFTNGTRIKNGTQVVRMMYYKEMLMYVNLPEKNYQQVEKGQDVVVTNYSMPDDTLFGKIDQISPSIDPDARTFKCIVSIDNPKYKLLPGMFVKADLVINREENAIVIPKELVKGRAGYNTVFVIDEGSAMERGIRTGITNGSNVMVTKGLEPGDRIVIKGYETLRNRSKVKIMNEEVQQVQSYSSVDSLMQESDTTQVVQKKANKKGDKKAMKKEGKSN